MAKLVFDIPDEEKAKLRAMAKSEKKTMTAILREWIATLKVKK